MTFHHLSCSNFLLAVQIALIESCTKVNYTSVCGKQRCILYQSLSRTKLQEARLNTYKTCIDGHVGIEGKAMEKEDCAASMRSNRSVNIYGWHYWNQFKKQHDTRLFNSQWNALKLCPLQIMIIFQSNVFLIMSFIYGLQISSWLSPSLLTVSQFEYSFAIGGILTLILKFYWLLKSLVSWSSGRFQ